jgi:hypothetical protein
MGAPGKGELCKVEGCNEPRWEGVRNALCREHYREYKARVSAASYARRMGKPDAPPVTRKNAKPVRAPKAKRQVRSKPAKPQTVSLLLVDKRTGEALRVTGTVTARVALEDLRGDGTQYERVAVALVGKG